jgi:hypothetical protein
VLFAGSQIVPQRFHRGQPVVKGKWEDTRDTSNSAKSALCPPFLSVALKW